MDEHPHNFQEDFNVEDDSEQLNEGDIAEVFDAEQLGGPDHYASDDEDMPGSSNASALDATEVVDDSLSALQAHEQDCFSIAVASGRFLASGGEDDVAYVWDQSVSESDPIIKIEHADSVTAVVFNSSETLLATGDMSGKIVVTEILTRKTRAELNDCSDLEWLKWHNTSDILFAGDSDGMIWMWLIGPKGVAQSKVYAGSGAACTSGFLMPDGRRILAGYSDGILRLWQLKEQTSSQLSLRSPITAVQHHLTQPIAVVGTQKGSFIVVNTTEDQLKIVSVIPPLSDAKPADDEEEDVNQCVECIALAPSHPWVAIGRNDGSLCVYETFSSSPRSIYRSPNLQAINCAIWAMDGITPFLITGSVDGQIRIFDGRDGSIFKELGNGGDDVLDLLVLDSNPLRLMTAGAGGIIRMFDLSRAV